MILSVVPCSVWDMTIDATVHYITIEGSTLARGAWVSILQKARTSLRDNALLINGEWHTLPTDRRLAASWAAQFNDPTREKNVRAVLSSLVQQNQDTLIVQWASAVPERIH